MLQSFKGQLMENLHGMPTDVPTEEPDEVDWDAKEEWEEERADWILNNREN
jgi:hypothetical protein